MLLFSNTMSTNRPISPGSHVESQENKKLCFYTASLTVNSHLGEACHASFLFSWDSTWPRVTKVYKLNCFPESCWVLYPLPEYTLIFWRPHLHTADINTVAFAKAIHCLRCRVQSLCVWSYRMAHHLHQLFSPIRHLQNSPDHSSSTCK